MPDRKYKVGDKVRSKISLASVKPGKSLKKGDKGIVTGVKQGSHYTSPYDVVFKDRSDEPFYMKEHELEKRLF